MSNLRIYGIARTRAFRAIWIAKELGLDYEHVPIEIGAAGARKPEYLAINPNGRLPAIEEDGFVLWESLSITMYLAKKHSLGRLYPGAPQPEAKLWQWTLWAANELERSVNLWSLHAIRLLPEDRDPQRLAEAIDAVTPRFQVLDGALADRPYLLGYDFTVADLNVSGVVSRALDMDLSGTPRMGDWLRRCMERPAALAARQLRDESDAQSSPDVIRMIARNARV